MADATNKKAPWTKVKGLNPCLEGMEEERIRNNQCGVAIRRRGGKCALALDFSFNSAA